MSDYACFDFNFLMHKFSFFYCYENLPWQYIKMEVNLLGMGEDMLPSTSLLFFLDAVILFNWLEIQQSFWQVNGYK